MEYKQIVRHRRQGHASSTRVAQVEEVSQMGEDGPREFARFASAFYLEVLDGIDRLDSK